MLQPFLNLRKVFLLCSPKEQRKFMFEMCPAPLRGLSNIIEDFVIYALPNSPAHEDNDLQEEWFIYLGSKKFKFCKGSR
jgi:hypothetical protein